MEDTGAGGPAQGVVAATTPTLPAYGHAPFRGTFRLKLEATGRIALPAAFKGAFEGLGLVRAQRDRFLNLWTPGGFDAVVQALIESQPGGVVDPRTRKRLHMSTSEVSIDRQSRFVVPPELRAKVSLGEQIVLAGSIEAIEIWSAEAFAAEEATLDEADLFFDGFEGL